MHQLTSGYKPTNKPQYTYKLQYKPNKYQLAPTQINLAPPISKMIAMNIG